MHSHVLLPLAFCLRLWDVFAASYETELTAPMDCAVGSPNLDVNDPMVRLPNLSGEGDTVGERGSSYHQAFQFGYDCSEEADLRVRALGPLSIPRASLEDVWSMI